MDLDIDLSNPFMTNVPIISLGAQQNNTSGLMEFSRFPADLCGFSWGVCCRDCYILYIVSL